MKEKIEQYAKEMLENLEVFLPVDKAMEISEAEVNSYMKYVVYVEELENYDSPDNNVLLEEYREYYGVEPDIKEQEDNEFEVEICNAPTYIELLKWLKEN